MHITDSKITIIAGLIVQEQENQKMQKGTEWLDPENVLTPIWLGTPDANTQTAHLPFLYAYVWTKKQGDIFSRKFFILCILVMNCNQSLRNILRLLKINEVSLIHWITSIEFKTRSNISLDTPSLPVMEQIVFSF